MHIVIAIVVLLTLVYLLSKALRQHNPSSSAAGDSLESKYADPRPGLQVAFISGGKLFYKDDRGDIAQIHSPYVQEITDRLERQRERHAWKQNTSFEISASGGRRQFESDEAQIVATSAQFYGDNILLYCLKDAAFGGLFVYDLESKVEKRLLHKQNLSLIDLNLDPAKGKILCSTNSKNAIANIALMNSDGSQFQELTGGDTFDSAPAWVPGEDNEILYQSSGLARAPDGSLLAQGNATIQLLNMKSGIVSPIMEDPQYDFLQPRVCPQGDLHFIRRPFEQPKYGPGNLFLDTLLFPFRLLRAVFHYLNFFSMIYSRKPLTSASGPALHADLKDIILKGKRIDAEKALRTGMKVNGVPSLVPGSWQLVRRTHSGTESILATNVASYDILSDGQVIYSNGRGVFLLGRDHRSTLILKSDVIADVIARSTAVRTHEERREQAEAI